MLDEKRHASTGIEVTEEMIEAGVLALCSQFDDVIPLASFRARCAVQDIYRQMREQLLLQR